MIELIKRFNKLIPLLFILGCQTGIRFDPNFHIGDYEIMAIKDRNNNIVYSDQEEFNQYACMHETKVMELKEILRKARMPRKNKDKTIFHLDKLLIRMKSVSR